MGLRMDDIHSPSIASRAVDPIDAPVAATNEESLLRLMDQVKRLEAELSALSSVLDSHGVGMSTSLTTFDGFPRDDIDVAQVRVTRARIVRMRTDYKELMSKVEAGLIKVHADYRESGTEDGAANSKGQAREKGGHDDFDKAARSSAIPSNIASDQSGLVETPFAIIKEVALGSPAAEAGLKKDDRVRRVGDVTWLNHERLSKVAEVVSKSEGKKVLVRVSRSHRDTDASETEELELSLTPRAGWGGRGLLGCHLVLV